MDFNNTGKLCSIDLPGDDKQHDIGYFIPDYLTQRWDLTRGYSRNELEPVLRRVSSVDWFIHDSDHTYEHMHWEYQTALPYIKDGGRLLSHDIYANPSFWDFCEEQELEYTETGGLGIANKNSHSS
jgi:hypothetical protein